MASIRTEGENREQRSFLPGLERLGEQMVRLYGPPPPEPVAEPLTVADWVPSVNVSQTDAEYTIEADLPGTVKEDVCVQLDGDVLTLEGVRRHETREERSNYIRVECAYGRFSRRFVLPPDAARERITADHREGILRVSIPRLDKSASTDRSIPVSGD